MSIPSIPVEQCADPAARKRRSLAAAPAPRRQDDHRSDDDDDNQRRVLIPWVRYADLVDAGVVGSWTQLLRLIDHEGFPVGVMLSPNIRAWRLDHVEEWLATRPTARKVPPPASKPRGRRRAATEENLKST